MAQEQQSHLSPSQKVRSIPWWITVPLITLAAGGAGYYVWSAYRDNREMSEPTGVKVDEKETRYIFEGQTVRVEVAKNLINGNRDLRTSYATPVQFTNEELRLAQIRDQLFGWFGQRYLAAMKLTSEQTDKLKRMPILQSMVGYDKADRDRLLKLFEAWDRATNEVGRHRAERELGVAMEEIGKRCAAATAAAVKERAAQTAAILTRQQIAAYEETQNRPYGGGGGGMGRGPRPGDPTNSTRPSNRYTGPGGSGGTPGSATRPAGGGRSGFGGFSGFTRPSTRSTTKPATRPN